MIAHCLFEQSGTFKNEFNKLGIEAFDYDIQNEYGQTDFQVDLFNEIIRGYENKSSIFDNINPEDVILAFFPCTRFESQIQLWMAGNCFSQTKWTDEEKLEYARKKHIELAEFYQIISKLFLVCLKRKLRLIVENPYTQPHYLTTYFPIKPVLIDKDRSLNGDYVKKPTQYWFVNIKPANNVIFEPIEEVPLFTICGGSKAKSISKSDTSKSTQTNRSTIHPQYANRFIRQFILENNETELNQQEISSIQ
jgi:hypothetical protein